MKAITLWPEWAYAIQKLGKDGENRSWRLWDSLIGQWVAIHAGMRPIMSIKAGTAREEELAAFADSLRIVGVPIEGRGNWRDVERVRGHIVQIVRFGRPTQFSQSKWAAEGAWFWPIVERINIEPIPCRGAQGLWDVPADVLAQLWAQGVAV